jgi:hypothetical protein
MASLGLVPISQPHELSQNEVYNAWAHYTGVPEAFTGGVGVIGFNVVMQGGQAKLGMSAGLYQGGFLSAFSKEFVYGTLAMATILTIIDPEHKHPSGLDETRFYKEHLEGTWTQIKANARTSSIPLQGKFRAL